MSQPSSRDTLGQVHRGQLPSISALNLPPPTGYGSWRSVNAVLPQYVPLDRCYTSPSTGTTGSPASMATSSSASPPSYFSASPTQREGADGFGDRASIRTERSFSSAPNDELRPNSRGLTLYASGTSHPSSTRTASLASTDGQHVDDYESGQCTQQLNAGSFKGAPRTVQPLRKGRVVKRGVNERRSPQTDEEKAYGHKDRQRNCRGTKRILEDQEEAQFERMNNYVARQRGQASSNPTKPYTWPGFGMFEDFVCIGEQNKLFGVSVDQGSNSRIECTDGVSREVIRNNASEVCRMKWSLHVKQAIVNEIEAYERMVAEDENDRQAATGMNPTSLGNAILAALATRPPQDTSVYQRLATPPPEYSERARMRWDKKAEKPSTKRVKTSEDV